MKQLRTYLQNYKLFTLALITAAIAVGMELGKQPATAHWLLAIVSVVGTTLLLWYMAQDLRHGRYSLNLLGLTAIVAALLFGEYWAAMAVLLVLAGAELLMDLARQRTQAELRALVTKTPLTAEVLRKGKGQHVAASEVHPGDKIVIQTNAAVPADATIIKGTSNFDESLLTGEVLPQSKQAGSLILAGSVNLGNAITAKVTASAEHSQYQQLIRLVRNASESRAPFMRLAERYSLPFTFAALALAGTAWALTSEADRFLDVIVSATPVPLLMAVPIAIRGGMLRASRYGIVVKTGSAFEHLADAQTLAFEKTGTLTSGELSVRKVQAFGKFKKDEVLRLAASLEQNSGHAVAQAIVTDARLKQVKLLKAKLARNQAGQGVSGTLKGALVVVGRLDFLKNSEVRLPTDFKEDQITDTTVFVAVDGHLAGYITLNDDLRTETQATLERLRELGITHTALLSGDSSAHARQVSKALGINKAHGNLSPSNKLLALSELQPRPVAFVGDGVQDAPLLTAANAGIALGAKGSAAAFEAADVLIMPNSLGKVAESFEIAKRTFAVARQCVAVGMGLNLVFMGVMATGKLMPLIGAGLQAAVIIIAVIYALRAHDIKPSNVHQQ